MFSKKKKPKGMSYYERNKGRILAAAKRRYSIKREEILMRASQRYYATRLLKPLRPKKKGTWHQRNVERTRAQCKRYYESHKEERRARRRTIEYQLAGAIRSRIKDALNGRTKVGSAVKDLGCTVQELRYYLEGKFTDGMSWENRGFTGWHVDHVIPLAFFDLTDREQFKKACHYSNLQPLWAKDNLVKKDKLPNAYV